MQEGSERPVQPHEDCDEFPEHFGQRSHGMKAGSSLRQFEGETRLFSEDEWERLTEESNKPRGATAG